MITLGPVDISDPLEITFHFGPDEGHQCDQAEFDWYLNDIFVARLNFDNLATGLEVIQGPFTIAPEDYGVKDGCGTLVFSFICAELVGGCHEGAAFDIDLPDGSIKTFYLRTSAPTPVTMCELYGSELSTPP
jgi:hypothetical protein